MFSVFLAHEEVLNPSRNSSRRGRRFRVFSDLVLLVLLTTPPFQVEVVEKVVVGVVRRVDVVRVVAAESGPDFRINRFFRISR